MKISVYQTATSMRVVAGDHKPADIHTKLQPRVYADAAQAYATETDQSVREAILRIDPTAAETSPAARHHIVKGAKADNTKRFIIVNVNRSEGGNDYMVKFDIGWMEEYGDDPSTWGKREQALKMTRTEAEKAYGATRGYQDCRIEEVQS